MIERHIGNRNELPLELQRDVVKDLHGFLGQGDTLLLLSGGSVGKDLAKPLLTALAATLPFKGNLHVALIDERFGPPWHRESNMLLLKNTGALDVIEKYGFDIHFILSDAGKKRLQTAQEYEQILRRLFERCAGRVLAIFGVGPDGHTAGVKPPIDMDTYEKLFENNHLVAEYEHPGEFERVTMAPRAILEVARAYIYAVGDNKKEALFQMLHGKPEEIYKYPAIIFQQHPQVFLYTDQQV